MKRSTDHRVRFVRALAPLALAASLAACSSGGAGAPSTAGGAAAEPQTIVFTYTTSNAKETYFEDLAKDYMAAHPGTTIKTNKIALNAADQTIPTQLQGGNGPDVFWTNAGSGQQDSIGQLQKGDLLLPLPEAVYKGIPASEMAGYALNGKTYGVPYYTAVDGFIWNDELAKSNGVTITATSTLDEVIAQCPSVTAKGLSLFGLAGSIPQNTAFMTLTLAASTVYGPNPNWNADRAAGKTTFASSEGWKKALQSIVDMNKAGCFQKGAAGAGFDALTNGAGQGKLFGFFAPSGAAKDIMDGAGGKVKLIVLPTPAPAGTPTTMMVASNAGLAINKATKSPKLAIDFLTFTVTPAQQKKLAAASGGIPLGTPAASDLLDQYKPVAALLESGKTTSYPADGWPNGEVYTAMGSGVTGLLTGQKSVDDVLKAMDSAWG